jgi:UrcA family protein
LQNARATSLLPPLPIGSYIAPVDIADDLSESVMQRIPTAPALFGLSVLLASVPALAQSEFEPSIQVVSFTDLNLSKRAHQRKFDRRISTAIANVCGLTSSAHPAGQNAVRRCRRETLELVSGVRERVIASPSKSFRIAPSP